MTYTKLPISIAGAGDPLLLYAERCSVAYGANGSPRRKLGNGIDGYGFDAGIGVGISVDFFVGQTGVEFTEDVYNYTGLQEFELTIGGNTYDNVFIDQINFSVSPLQVVTASATFTSYDPPSLGLAGDDSVADYDDPAVYSYTGVKIGGIPNLVTNLKYNKTYSRTPVYTLGQERPQRHLMDAVDVSMSIESTGIDTFIPYSGEEIIGDFGFTLSDNLDVKVGSGAMILSQDYGVSQGGAVSTTMEIQEAIL